MAIAGFLFSPFIATFRSTAGRVDLGAKLQMAWRIISTRHHLQEMDERMLKDIGISRSQARFEATRSVWDAMR